ncbi:MAG: hypothetical protein L0271_17790 [Gemmatimonadetes bacterium]|nr:hypothetical protein [Gemmatimonadota bacterium]
MDSTHSADSGASATVLALPGDLLFSARIRGAAKAAAVEVAVCARPEVLYERASRDSTRLVLVDLDARGWDPVDVISTLTKTCGVNGDRVVAFVSHVRSDVIAAARNAGAGRVLARSAFVRDLPELMRGASA